MSRKSSHFNKDMGMLLAKEVDKIDPYLGPRRGPEGFREIADSLQEKEILPHSATYQTVKERFNFLLAKCKTINNANKFNTYNN